MTTAPYPSRPVAPPFDLRTVAGGRGYVAWYFANVMKRHDFTRYINDRLAVDFACALASHLQAAQPAPAQQDALAAVTATADLGMDQVLSIADAHAEESREDGVRLLDRGGLVAFAKEVARAALVAAPAAPAVQDAPYSIDADPKGIRARVAEAISAALASGVKKSDMPSENHWLRPFWMHAYFAVVQYNALRDVTDAMLDVPGALNQAVRDVLAERHRQVEREGYDPEHDDSHELGEIGALAALYLMPQGAREWDTSSTGYGATLGEALLPADWSMPKMGDDPRQDLVKGAACGLAELERFDRAAARAAQGSAL